MVITRAIRATAFILNRAAGRDDRNPLKKGRDMARADFFSVKDIGWAKLRAVQIWRAI
jgi:hypothetical protein